MIWSLKLNNGLEWGTPLTESAVREVFDYMDDWGGINAARADDMRDCEKVLALEVGASYVDADRFRWTRLS